MANGILALGVHRAFDENEQVPVGIGLRVATGAGAVKNDLGVGLDTPNRFLDALAKLSERRPSSGRVG